jgi:serine/threonine protein kinase
MQHGARFKYQQVAVSNDLELGRGNYGRVCKAMCDDLPCAIKLLNPKIFQFQVGTVDDPGLERFRQDCEMLSSITHPCLVQYMDAYVQSDTGQAVLLMELMDESLTSFLERSLSPLPIYIQIDICYDVVQALSYLHSNGIVHRNLTGQNVLVRSGSRAKVADFGMMKMVHSQQASNPHLKHMTMHASSTSYMPPEVFRFPPSYSENIDIFSFGVITLQVITRHFPHPKASKVSEIERRKSDISTVDLEHILLPFTLSCLKDTDILRPPAAQLCRKLKQLQESPAYSDSKLKREEALQEIDAIQRELSHVQRENEDLLARLESVQLENRQLSKLISKCSDSIGSKVQKGTHPYM